MSASVEDYDPRLESEQYVLGALLRDTAKAWPQVRDLLIVGHFAREKHRVIYAALLAVIEDHGIADSYAVAAELHRRGQLEIAGSLEYIAGLHADCPTAETAGAHAKLMREAAGSANVIDFATELAKSKRSPADAARLLTEEAERLRRDFVEPAEHTPPERRAMRWSALQPHEPPERTWRIGHWLTGGPTLLAGKGGIGKSLLAQTLATALALGRSFVDEIREPATVLVWACEDDHNEIWRRQRAICRFFDVPLSALEGKLIIEPRVGMENTLYALAFGAPVWTPLKTELAAQIGDYHASVVFLDNIAQTYGANENDRHQVTQFVNGLAGISLDASTVIMGHPAKATDSEFSGSTAWEAAVRMRWYMGRQLPDQKPEEEAEDDPNVRYICKRKTNYAPEDYRKLTYDNGLFVPEVKGPGDGFADRWSHGDRAKGAEDCVLNAIETFVAQGIRVTDGKTSPDYLPKKMREGKLAGSFAPKELSSALAQLRLSGKVTEGPVGKYGNRTSKIGLVVAT